MVALCWGGLAAPAAAVGQADFVALSSSVLKIEVSRQQGGYSLGSGVVVADQRVVTNCHVTRDARAVTVLKHGARWPVTAQAVDALHDLCVLQVPGIRSDVVVRGQAGGLKTSQKVSAIGYTGGMGIQNSEGEVVALYRYDGASVIQSSNWFTSGASGGGLFDEDLKLVGILTFRMRGGEAHYFSAPIEWIVPLLADDSAFQPVAPIDKDTLAFWQQPLERQPAFLQATTLSSTGQWPQLRRVAQRWLDMSRSEPQAWFARGQADEGLDHPQEALVAFERAVSLDPAFAGAWLRVGLLRAKLGLRQAADEALKTLQPLDAELAGQLAARINSL